MSKDDHSENNPEDPEFLDRDLIDAARREVEAARGRTPVPDGNELPFAATSDLVQEPLFSAPPPDSFTGYRILREIHRGGQGVVYQAIQESTKRKVAIKVMKEGPLADAAEKARFEREISVLGQLNHPNIVGIHDTGSAAGNFYFVMDYVSGQPLDVYMASREHSIEETLGLFGRICDAVNAAHLRGIIHRDLKPANIRVDAAGEPHILDFGLAKVATGEVHASVITMTGQFVGSLPWASPEQAEGSPSKTDLRTDVYSLGVILYQMLTGKFPYEVIGNIRDVLDRIMKATPVRPSTLRKKIDNEVETIVLKALSKERERRYQTAGEFGRDIQHYLNGEPIEAKRESFGYILRKQLKRYRIPVAVAAGFVLLLTVGLIASLSFWHQAESEADEAKKAWSREKSARTEAERLRELEAEQRQTAQEAQARAEKALAEAKEARKAADAARTAEKEQRQKVEAQAEELKQALYAGQVGFAQLAYAQGEARRMGELLVESARGDPTWEWRHLAWLADQSERIFFSTHSWIPSLAYSPDGTRLVSGNGDGTVTVWDSQSGKELRTISAHTKVVSAVSFSPDGKLIASASGWAYRQPGREDPAPLRLWNAGSGEAVGSLEIGWVDVTTLAFSPGGARLVVGDDDGYLSLWDVGALECLRAWKAHESWNWETGVCSVAYSPDGKRIVSGGDDELIKIWDAVDGTDLQTLEGHGHTVESVCLSADGRRIVSTSSDRRTNVWDAASGKLIRSIEMESWAEEAVFTPSGEWIVGMDGFSIAIWNADTGQRLKSWPAGSLHYIGAFAVRPDGQQVALTGSDGTLFFWDLQGTKAARVFRHGNGVQDVAVSPDGRRLFTATGFGRWWVPHPGDERAMRVWDVKTGAELRRLAKDRGSIKCLAVSTDGKLLAGGSTDRAVTIWNAESLEVIRTFAMEGWVGKDLEFSPEGTRIAVATSEREGAGPVVLYDLRTGELTQTFGTSEGRVHRIRFSPDGKKLAVAQRDVTVWDVAAGTQVRQFDFLGPKSGIGPWGLGFSPDGSRLATMERHRTVAIWKTDTWEREGTTALGRGTVLTCLAFTPDSRRLVIGDWEGDIRVVDTETRSVLVTLRCGFGVTSLALSADGSCLAAGTVGHTAHVWHALGKDDARVASAFLARALKLEDDARHDEAEPLARAAVGILEDLLPSRHPLMLRSTSALARIWAGQGRAEEAEKSLKEVLDVGLEVLGEDHGDTQVTIRALVSLYEKEGREGDKEKLLDKLGPKAASLHFRGRAKRLNFNEKVDEAVASYQQALDVLRRKLPDDEAAQAETLEELAQLLVEEERRSEAEAAYREALVLRRRAHTGGHPATVETLRSLRQLVCETGRKEEAAELFREDFEIFRERFGEKHRQALAALRGWRDFLSGEGRLDEAEGLARTEVEIRSRHAGTNELETLRAERELVKLLEERGKLDEAEARLRRVLHVFVEKLGERRNTTLEAKTDLARLLDLAGNRGEAIGVRERVLGTWREVKGDDGLETLRAECALAWALRDAADRLDEAEKLARRALDGLKTLHDDEETDIAAARNTLGVLLLRRGQLDEATAVFESGLADAEDLPKRPLARYRLHYGQCLTKTGDRERAEEQLTKAYDYFGNRYGDQHQRTREAIESLVALYEAWGKIEETAKWKAKLEAAPAGDGAAREKAQ